MVKTAAEFLAEKQAQFAGPIDARTFSEQSRPSQKPGSLRRAGRASGTIVTSGRRRTASAGKAERDLKVASGRLKNLNKWKRDYVRNGSSFTSPARVMTAELGPEHWTNQTVGQVLKKLFRR